MIRSARLSDVPEIAAIHVAAWSGAHPGAPSKTYDQRVELWNHVLGGGARRTQVWVELDHLGQLRGFVAAGAARVLRGRFDGELVAIYVAPGCQRQGVGRALVREVFAWFKKRGFRSAMAWIPEVGQARAFLRKLGAEPLPDRRVVGAGPQAMAEAALCFSLL